MLQEDIQLLRKFFNTVEINSTFYHYPSESTVHGLTRISLKDFIFSAKPSSLSMDRAVCSLPFKVMGINSKYFSVILVEAFHNLDADFGL